MGTSDVLTAPCGEGNDGSGKKDDEVKVSGDCPYFDPEGNWREAFGFGIINVGGEVGNTVFSIGRLGAEQCKRLPNAIVEPDQVRQFCRKEFAKCKVYQQ